MQHLQGTGANVTDWKSGAGEYPFCLGLRKYAGKALADLTCLYPQIVRQPVSVELELRSGA